VLDYYGIDIKEHEIIKLAGTNCKGTSVEGILSILRQHGLDCKYEKMSISEVKKIHRPRRPGDYDCPGMDCQEKS